MFGNSKTVFLGCVFSGIIIFSTFPAFAQDKVYDVIVIGAGISGIAAADALGQLGYDVVVLEAKDTIGGRVTTDYSTGIPLDMGASWIHGVKYNPINILAEKYDIETVQTISEAHIDSHVFFQDGKKLKVSEQAEIENRFDDFSSYISLNYEYIPKNNFLSVTFDPIALYSIDSDKSVEDVLNEYLANTNQEERRDEFESIATYWYTNTWNTDISKISARHYNMEAEYSGEEVIFPDGYKQIIDNISKELDIRTNHVVTKIDYGRPIFDVYILKDVMNIFNPGPNVKVFVEGKSDPIKSKYVLSTLPLGVLKYSVTHEQKVHESDGFVDFEPDLPEEKIKSINNMGMGVMNKAWFVFDRVFWEDEKNNQFIAVMNDENETEWALFFNAYKYLGEPVLLGFNSGQYARDLETKSPEEIKNDAMKNIRKIYPDATFVLKNYTISSWSTDPFTRGAYSYPAIDSTPIDSWNLAKDVDAKLFFAGEATAPDAWGTVHGAYLSGIKAAEDIDFWYSLHNLYTKQLYAIVLTSIGLGIIWPLFLNWRIKNQIAHDAAGKPRIFPWRSTLIIAFTCVFILIVYYFLETQLGVIPDIFEIVLTPLDDECLHLSKLIDAVPYMRLSPEEENLYHQQYANRCYDY